MRASEGTTVVVGEGMQPEAEGRVVRFVLTIKIMIQIGCVLSQVSSSPFRRLIKRPMIRADFQPHL